MSLSSTTRRNDYTGNGSNSVYAYSFRVFSQTDLVVKVKNTSTGTVTTLVLTTDYTVSGVGSSAGGNVTLVNAAQAWLTAGKLSTGYTLAIRRVMSLVQNTDIRNQGSYFAETHEDAFDYLTMIDQTQQDDIDRSVKLPDTIPASTFDPTLPTTIADTASVGAPILVNSTHTGWVMGSALSGVPTFTVSGTQPSAPAAGIMAFWLDTTVNQMKVYKETSATWEVFA